MTATEYVVLVDEKDQEIGIAEKLAAHEKNLRHRAFSIFIFRQAGKLELLLQQRALGKYHSPGLWTNTCCSHPRSGEDVITAGLRRLQEEMGVTTELKNLGWFHYIAHFPNGLTENEIDHVLIGMVDVNLEIKPNPEEVNDYRWISIDNLEKEIAENPAQFTPWLAKALNVVKAKI